MPTRRLPLDVPVPVRLTPRAWYALEAVLSDPDVADLLEARLHAEGVEEDATEDAYEHVRATVRRALENAGTIAAARVLLAKVYVRMVIRGGKVTAGGVVWQDDDLRPLVGAMVQVRPTEVEDELMARVETLGGQFVAVARAVRRTDGQKLAA